MGAIEDQIARYKAGRLPKEQVKALRLRNGIYGQRQDGVHMVRVKVPNGALEVSPLDALADVAERHGHGLAHMTTRQDVRLHHDRAHAPERWDEPRETLDHWLHGELGASSAATSHPQARLDLRTM